MAQLGFGCSGLMARLSRPESRALLETAYDHGIRWFDVARSYGYGEAESVVGEFVAALPPSERDGVTVVTKAGILPPPRSAGLSVAKAVARRIASLHPALGRRLRARAAAMVQHGVFAPAAIGESLDASLAALQADRADLLLLHDCTPQDLRPELLELLQSWQSAGRIGGFGLATDATTILTALDAHAAFTDTLQFAANPWNSPGEVIRAAGPRRVVTHSALGPGFARLNEALRADVAAQQRWSDAIGIDAARPDAVGHAFLAAALRANPGGIVLFSSKRATTIAANARVAASDIAPEAAARLKALTQAMDGVAA